MTDLNDVIAAIERLRTDLRADSQSDNVKIVSGLNDLKRAIESRPRTAHSVVAIVCGVLIYMFISSWVGNMWNSKSVLPRHCKQDYKLALEQSTLPKHFGKDASAS